MEKLFEFYIEGGTLSVFEKEDHSVIKRICPGDDEIYSSLDEYWDKSLKNSGIESRTYIYLNPKVFGFLFEKLKENCEENRKRYNKTKLYWWMHLIDNSDNPQLILDTLKYSTVSKKISLLRILLLTRRNSQEENDWLFDKVNKINKSQGEGWLSGANSFEQTNKD